MARSFRRRCVVGRGTCFLVVRHCRRPASTLEESSGHFQMNEVLLSDGLTRDCECGAVQGSGTCRTKDGDKF